MDPDPQIRNAELRIRIQEANYLRIHRNRAKILLKSMASNLQEKRTFLDPHRMNTIRTKYQE